MSRARTPIKAYTENGTRRVFAGALDWPGWCRSARDEDGALDALVAYGPRYAAVVRETGLPFHLPEAPSGLNVVERLKGDATTDFGAPGIPPAADNDRVTARQLTRLRTLLEACWAALDRAADAAVEVELRKGPRGGGRELDAILEHVTGAEGAYLGRSSAHRPKTVGDDVRATLATTHAAVLDALARAVTEGLPEAGPRGGAIWTPRYFVRRTAWHALDHAWEIEDRTLPS
jgi:hypothetical protein